MKALRSLATIAVLVAGVALVGAAPASAQEIVEVSELITNPGPYAGRTVMVRGELIGDYGFRANGFMWTQLNDDSYAASPVAEGGALTGSNTGIGIRMPDELGEGLDPPGGYRRRGPVVLVSGTFAYHDPGRQGETFIDVEALEVLEPGISIEEGIDLAALAAGLALLAAAAALHWWRRRRLAEV